MEHRKDIAEQIVELGDTICWNPAGMKGIAFGVVVDFQKASGLPVVLVDERFRHLLLGQGTGKRFHHVPKTGFVLINKNNN